MIGQTRGTTFAYAFRMNLPWCMPGTPAYMTASQPNGCRHVQVTGLKCIQFLKSLHRLQRALMTHLKSIDWVENEKMYYLCPTMNKSRPACSGWGRRRAW